MRPIQATITSSNSPVMVRLDQFHGAACACQVVASGGANYTIDTSFDDPDDPVNPVAKASMLWDTGMIPASAVNGINTFTFFLQTAPIYIRVTLNNALGAVRATFLQYAAHRSVVSSPMPSSQMLSLPQH